MDPMIQPNNGTTPPVPGDHPLDNSLTPEPTAPTPSMETPAAPAPTPIPVSAPQHTDTKAGDLYPQASTPADVPPAEPVGEQHHNHDAAPDLPKHSGTPVVAVIIAIIIALALAGLTIFAYLKTRSSVKDTNTTTTQPTTTAQTTKATTTDVDNTTKDLDSALNSVDDNKDFASTDISDTALGL